MLKSISIKNYVLIDKLNISFNSGFSVITGETGAGKTILVDGISLLLGKRADLSVNRDKTKKCVIEGVFDIGAYNLKSIFDLNELDYDSETILRREISPSGKSRAFINDSPVNLHQLSKIGSRIIDFGFTLISFICSETIKRCSSLQIIIGALIFSKPLSLK